MKERLDVLLVKRNLAESREKAKAIIMAGQVYVNGQKEDKAGSTFDIYAPIEVRGSTLKYVSRGGQIPLFTIYCATGSSRDYYAGRTDLLQLGETAQAVYFARIADEAEQSSLEITAEAIQNRFSLVKQDWNN